MQIKTSTLDNETLVMIVELDDPFPEMINQFEECGHGFAAFGDGMEIPVAMIDGRIRTEPWCTDDHLLAIEAHELGHIRKKSSDEVVAELEGIRLLEAAGYTSAANLLRERGIINEG
jgi:hypothetical protein